MNSRKPWLASRAPAIPTISSARDRSRLVRIWARVSGRTLRSASLGHAKGRGFAFAALKPRFRNEHSLLIRRTLIFLQARLDTKDSFLIERFGSPVVPGFRVTEPKLNRWNFGSLHWHGCQWMTSVGLFFVPCR